MLKVGIYLKIKDIQYLQNTYYVPGPTMSQGQTPSLIIKVNYILLT